MSTEDWQEVALIRLRKLQMDKNKILDLDARLRYQDLVSEADRYIFHSAIEAIDKEMESIKFDLVLEDMLASNLPFDEFMKKFGKWDV